MQFEFSVDPSGSGDMLFSGRIASSEMFTERMAVAIGKQIVISIVDEIVNTKGIEIIAMLDLNAIANLVAAQAAAQIAAKISISK